MLIQDVNVGGISAKVDELWDDLLKVHVQLQMDQMSEAMKSQWNAIASLKRRLHELSTQVEENFQRGQGTVNLVEEFVVTSRRCKANAEKVTAGCGLF